MTEKANAGGAAGAGEDRECVVNPWMIQTFASLGSLFIVMSGGMVVGFTAILLPQLKETTSPLQATRSEESWIATAAVLPMAIGCIYGGWSMGYFGRRGTQIHGAFGFLGGWIVIYLSPSVNTLLVGRLITGFCLGTTTPAAAVFLAEISDPKYRGMLTALFAMGISSGVALVHLVGTLLHWRHVALFASAYAVVCALLLLSLHETYAWFLERDNLQKSEESFFWYRGKSEDVRKEFNVIRTKHADVRKLKTQELLKECQKAQFLKPMLILILYFAATQLSGTNLLNFYAVSIMEKTVPGLNSYFGMLILDAFRVLLALLACVLCKKVPVRLLTFISGLGTALSSIFLAAFIDSASNKTYPFIALVLYVVFISIGFIPLPWTLCGELFQPATRGIGSGITTTMNFLVFAIVIKLAPDMFETFGTAAVFCAFGACTLIATIVLFFVLPETRGRSLSDIEDYFVKDKPDII